MKNEITSKDIIVFTTSFFIIVLICLYVSLRNKNLSESLTPIFSNQLILEKDNISENVWDTYSSSALSAGHNPAKAAVYADQLIIERNKRFSQTKIIGSRFVDIKQSKEDNE